MASYEDTFDYTQPTQPFEETTQPTQDDTPLINSHEKPVGKIVWRRHESISDFDIFLDTPVLIGRHRSCNIQVASSVSSNKHCEITASIDKNTKEYLIICKDLSSNGTFWNGKKIGKGNSIILSHGDVLEIKKGHYFTYLQLTRPRDNNKDRIQLDNKYQITEKVLGKGTFAEIRLVLKKDTQEQMAVKIMEKKNFSTHGSIGGGANYIHEINLLRGIKHQNIVCVYDVFETAKHVYIFMPLLQGGDLFEYILDSERLDEKEAKFIVYQVLLALKYLHDANIAHRDMKPENTLLVSKKPYSQVMLTDFGMAKATRQQSLMKTMCGTLQYIAPEMISSGVRPGDPLRVGYSKAVDCWSLGVMVYAMVSGMLPFTDDDTNPSVLFAQILSGHIDFSFPCWNTITIDCQSFISDLMRINPEKRMSVDNAFKHPWIASDSKRLALLYAECLKTNGDDLDHSDKPASSSAKPPNPKPHARKRVSDEVGSNTIVTAPAPCDGKTAIKPMGPPPAKKLRQEAV